MPQGASPLASYYAPMGLKKEKRLTIMPFGQKKEKKKQLLRPFRAEI